jgi:hypothetical protein
LKNSKRKIKQKIIREDNLKVKYKKFAINDNLWNYVSAIYQKI